MSDPKQNEKVAQQPDKDEAPIPADEAAEETREQAPPPEAPADPDKQLMSVREQLLRKAADFENYKRRTESEIQNIVRYANENLILAVLPIVDDLERSLKAGKSAEDVASFHKGVELIYQKLQKVLESHGVKPLETAGKPFDVHYHDAMMQLPKEDAEPNTILEEVEKGYEMNGKVIRHAKVIVSAPMPEDERSGGEDA